MICPVALLAFLQEVASIGAAFRGTMGGWPKEHR